MRMTRAALRAQAQDDPQLIHEDPDADSFHSTPDSDANRDPDRPPLKDITADANPPTTDDPFVDEENVPVKKAKSKKGAKKGKKDTHDDEQNLATEEQIETTNSDSFDTTLDSQTVSFNTSHQEISYENFASVTAEEELPLVSALTPPQTELGLPKTPKFDPSIHKPVEDIITPTAEDSFVEKITSRTPGRMLSFESEKKSPDSFVERVHSRTPRIEDSVEAIDALEDLIESVAQNLPDLDELKIESPVKSRRNTPARAGPPAAISATSSRKPVPTPGKAQRVAPAKTRSAPKATDHPKNTVSRPSTVKPTAKTAVTTKPINKKPIIDGNKARQLSAENGPPALSFSNSPAKNLPNTTQKRVPSTTLSTSRPAFVPAKSSKAPTRPTFQLPSEAISAKAKAQREERLKREAEAEKERKMFKARPIPTKVARPSTVPRENKASQARISLYANGVNKENVAPKPTIPPPPKARPTSLDAKPRASETRANSSVRRTTTSATAGPSKPRVSSMILATGQKLNVTKDDVVQQKAKGKEVFGRSKAELERAEKERREKEEATRKARAEAAERGRQASREWAEKQKKKIAAQTQSKVLSAKHSDSSLRGEKVPVVATAS